MYFRVLDLNLMEVINSWVFRLEEDSMPLDRGVGDFREIPFRCRVRPNLVLRGVSPGGKFRRQSHRRG